jgi:hypothetical protein
LRKKRKCRRRADVIWRAVARLFDVNTFHHRALSQRGKRHGGSFPPPHTLSASISPSFNAAVYRPRVMDLDIRSFYRLPNARVMLPYVSLQPVAMPLAWKLAKSLNSGRGSNSFLPVPQRQGCLRQVSCKEPFPNRVSQATLRLANSASSDLFSPSVLCGNGIMKHGKIGQLSTMRLLRQ